MRCVGVQTVPPRAATNAGRVEPSGLYQNVLGVDGNHRIPAAHNASQRERLTVVGDDEVVGFQRALAAVQQMVQVTVFPP